MEPPEKKQLLVMRETETLADIIREAGMFAIQDAVLRDKPLAANDDASSTHRFSHRSCFRISFVVKRQWS